MVKTISFLADTIYLDKILSFIILVSINNGAINKLVKFDVSVEPLCTPALLKPIQSDVVSYEPQINYAINTGVVNYLFQEF